MPGKIYSDAEKRSILENVHLTDAQIAALLPGRSPGAVKKKRQDLGAQKAATPPKSRKDLEPQIALLFFRERGTAEICAELGISSDQVQRWARKLGVDRSGRWPTKTERLAYSLLRRGMSARQIGERIGKSEKAVSRWKERQQVSKKDEWVKSR